MNGAIMSEKPRVPDIVLCCAAQGSESCCYRRLASAFVNHDDPSAQETVLTALIDKTAGMAAPGDGAG
nr:uncharacterized protein CTRU02_05865 [Colletotrichum truncatum]KAF6793610.1 hypothetical protein CTRU02_05865 [Colletotrichum truncatum]